MLWLALYFPRLSIEWVEQACMSGANDDPTPAIALGNRSHILASNAAALAKGVQPALKRATALALVPELKLLEQDLRQEQQALESMALTCLQFTPSVSLQYEASLEAGLGLKPAAGTDLQPRPAGLLLELQASLLLFGGRDPLLARIRQALAAHGFTMRMASAPVPGGAWLLALAQGEHDDAPLHVGHEGELNARLAPLPVFLLRQARPCLELLHGIGVRSLRDLAQLPRAGLARRFGKELLLAVDQALGKQPEPRRYFEAPAQFHQKLALLAQVENAQALLFAAQRLMQQLWQWLALRHAAVHQLLLLAVHEDHEPTRFELRLTEASRDLQRLSGLLRERLNVTPLPAPAETLILEAGDIVALDPPTESLFPMPRSARESLGRLIERLQVRLGRDQVQQVLLAQDHRPEAAYDLRPLEDLKPLLRGTPERAQAVTAGLVPGSSSALPGACAGWPESAPGLPRPLWFLPRPLPISERQQRPFYQSPLHLLAGPERIESGWWDNQLVQRDYFIAEDTQNNLYWLFRQRFPTPGWFIQGRFG